MKLWTIQPLNFYNKLITDGEIYSSEDYIDSDFKYAYQWIIKQMERRIGQRSGENIYPIWAWYQYKNIQSRRPDLRTSGFLPKGTKGVRIEFEKPENQILLSDFDLWHFPLNYWYIAINQILLSDFDLWHFPLNYWYIADNEEQERDFDTLLKNSKAQFMNRENYPSHLKLLIENSWNKALDMNYDSEYASEKFNNKRIQATFWNLKASEITKVDFFKAK